jgi:alpha-beta hydrolase superfamily lysophospholipase
VNVTGEGSQQADMKPTIVLVHGAFADASSWNGVIERLQQEGYTVIARRIRCVAWPPIPPTSQASSTRSTDRCC